eukprot:m.780603 g.780603  ORF g.780603 m.780603 type:complete len:306 (-) comp59137_c0_seq1:9-926(-)
MASEWRESVWQARAVLEGPDAVHQLEQLYDTLDERARARLHAHIHAAADLFTQQQQPHQDSPTMDIGASDRDDASTPLLFFAGLLPTDADASCLDQLFADAFDPQPAVKPMRERGLPDCFFLPAFPSTMLVGSDSTASDSDHSPNIDSPVSQPKTPSRRPSNRARAATDSKKPRRHSGRDQPYLAPPSTLPRRRSAVALGQTQSAYDLDLATLSLTEMPLPPGWRKATTETNLDYYVNDAMGLSSWFHPATFQLRSAMLADPSDSVSVRILSLHSIFARILWSRSYLIPVSVFFLLLSVSSPTAV